MVRVTETKVKEFIQKMEYIYNNPVIAGLCTYPEQYKYSSAKFYFTGEHGIYCIKEE